MKYALNSNDINEKSMKYNHERKQSITEIISEIKKIQNDPDYKEDGIIEYDSKQEREEEGDDDIDDELSDLEKDVYVNKDDDIDDESELLEPYMELDPRDSSITALLSDDIDDIIEETLDEIDATESNDTISGIVEVNENKHGDSIALTEIKYLALNLYHNFYDWCFPSMDEVILKAENMDNGEMEDLISEIDCNKYGFFFSWHV